MFVNCMIDFTRIKSEIHSLSLNTAVLNLVGQYLQC